MTAPTRPTAPPPKANPVNSKARPANPRRTSANARLVALLLRIGDDHLVLGHRLSEWCGHAPLLEEDLAMPNMALDLIGTARFCYGYAAGIEGGGRTEDHYAYHRDGTDFRHILMNELPNGDFARTMLRQFLFAAFMHPFWRAATHSSDGHIAAHAEKALKETAYHIRHAGEWVIRLGDGTRESRGRMEDALDLLGPYIEEMFESDDDMDALAKKGVIAGPDDLRQDFATRVAKTLGEAGLELPVPAFTRSGGRMGRHTEALGHLLGEMQFVQRAHPGLQW